jgi:hypothetical protein
MTMRSLIHHQRHGTAGAVYSFHAANSDELLQVMPPANGAGQHFVLFLAWDARAVSDESIQELAQKLIRLGLSYVVAWGPDCERVHDLFDDANILETLDSNAPDSQSVIMSTWHTDDLLAEALWFALHTAIPASPYEATTRSVIAVVIQNENWTRDVEMYLSDPAKLNAAVGE